MAMDSIYELIVSDNHYQHFNDDCFDVLLNGIIVYKDNKNDVCTNALQIAKRVVRNEIDFNCIHGFYKIVIVDKKSNVTYFWGDNIGSQFFYVDNLERICSDSFLKLLARRTSIIPSEIGIASLFQGYGLMTKSTVVDGINITDCNSYYIISEDLIVEKSKCINPLSLKRSMSFDDIMNLLIKSIDDRPFSAVCTAGTDSRVVLSYLVGNNVYPTKLILTGYEDNPDIKTAKELSKVMDIPLVIQNPADKDVDWIRDGFEFSDGIFDVVASYRHLKKTQWAIENGLSFEYGGAGGEFYKNGFCKPFRYRVAFQNTSTDSLKRNMFARAKSRQKWFGHLLVVGSSNLEEYIDDLVSSLDEKTVLQKYNALGIRIISGKVSLVGNNTANRGCVKIDPLLDADLIASVSKSSPFRLCMQRWQRKQIRNNSRDLCNYKTNQGLTCSLNSLLMLKDMVVSLDFYCSLVFLRIKKKMGQNIKDSAQHFWDRDYIEARDTYDFNEAIVTCKKIGVIDSSCSAEDIPIAQTGNILLLGKIFSNK